MSLADFLKKFGKPTHLAAATLANPNPVTHAPTHADTLAALQIAHAEIALLKCQRKALEQLLFAATAEA